MSDQYRRRNSLRLPDYNYASPAGIFVTFCTHNRQQIFGAVHDSTMRLSAYGNLLATTWQQIPEKFQGIDLDEYTIMPDHLHGILIFGTLNSDAMATCSEVVRWVKICVQRDISLAVKAGGPPYTEKLWQRSFYDRIIRTERELEEIRYYIHTNPARWSIK